MERQAARARATLVALALALFCGASWTASVPDPSASPIAGMKLVPADSVCRPPAPPSGPKPGGGRGSPATPPAASSICAPVINVGVPSGPWPGTSYGASWSWPSLFEPAGFGFCPFCSSWNWPPVIHTAAGDGGVRKVAADVPVSGMTKFEFDVSKVFKASVESANPWFIAFAFCALVCFAIWLIRRASKPSGPPTSPRDSAPLFGLVAVLVAIVLCVGLSTCGTGGMESETLSRAIDRRIEQSQGQWRVPLATTDPAIERELAALRQAMSSCEDRCRAADDARGRDPARWLSYGAPYALSAGVLLLGFVGMLGLLRLSRMRAELAAANDIRQEALRRRDRKRPPIPFAEILAAEDALDATLRLFDDPAAAMTKAVPIGPLVAALRRLRLSLEVEAGRDADGRPADVPVSEDEGSLAIAKMELVPRDALRTALVALSKHLEERGEPSDFWRTKTITLVREMRRRLLKDSAPST